MLRKIVNYAGSQIGWLACALGAANGNPWIGPAVVGIHVILHINWSKDHVREAKYILVASMLGLFVDSLKKSTGLLTYAAPFPTLDWLAPLWIVAMWALFATTLTASLAWLQGRYGLAALLGAIFGPTSYFAGERLGAITFNYDLLLTGVVLALVWGTVMPVLAWLARQMTGPSTSSETERVSSWKNSLSLLP